MKNTIIGIVVVLIIIVGVFWARSKVSAPEPVETPKTDQVFDFKNATYDIDGVKITLKDGQNEQTFPGSVTVTTTSYFGNEGKGDANGDGKEDASFIIMQDGGGTGLFSFLVVALKKDTGYEILNTVFLGDRIAPQTTEIRDEKVVVNYADRLPNEPLSARPSIGVSRIFKVENNKLVEIKGEFGEAQ